MCRKYIHFIIILFLSRCALASPILSKPKIINGIQTESQQLPWQVAVNYAHCGGTIIDTKWVLTAAHCIMSKDGTLIDADRIEITPNLIDLNDKNATSYWVEKVYLHPEYNNDAIVNDIALIKLATAEYDDHYKFDANTSLKLLSEDEQTIMDKQFENEWVIHQVRNSNLLASGWGDILPLEEQDGYDPHLRHTLLSGVPSDQCSSIRNEFFETNHLGNYLKNAICATSPDPKLATDTCHGDSGGPLVWQNPNHKKDNDKGLRLVGITSYGYYCGANEIPNVYAKVSIYRGWIEKTMNKSLDSIPVSTFNYDPFEADYSDAPKVEAINVPLKPLPTPPQHSGGSTSMGYLLFLFGLLFFKCTGMNFTQTERQSKL